jgi:hypothetical protein
MSEELVSSLENLGKTFLYNTLIAWAKANNKTFRACASTGIASTLLISGATAHSTFWVPVNLKSDTPSRMDAEKYYAESLRGAELIIIDEISMLHRDVLYYIDRALKDIAPVEKRELPFGGKVVVLGGMFTSYWVSTCSELILFPL